LTDESVRFAAGVWKKLETGREAFCEVVDFWGKFPLTWVVGGEPVSIKDSHPESMWALMSFGFTE
jgi:hypothetical protein